MSHSKHEQHRVLIAISAVVNVVVHVMKCLLCSVELIMSVVETTSVAQTNTILDYQVTATQTRVISCYITQLQTRITWGFWRLSGLTLSRTTDVLTYRKRHQKWVPREKI